jgi:carnitine O-palmitoyltransferase 1
MTQDGFVLYVPHVRFMLRSGLRAVHRARNNIASALWPARLRHVILLNFAVVVYVLRQPPTSWVRDGTVANLLWSLDSLQPWAQYYPTWYRVAYLANFCGTVGALAVSSLNRLILRQCLKYRGWMYEAKPGLFTKIWATVVKYGFMRQSRPQLYTYQGVLPNLPVPHLDDTCRRYLRTVKPLLPAEEYTAISEKAAAFQRQEGRRLQRFLTFRWWITENYIADWWLDIVYLRGRSSVLINSNYYGIGEGDTKLMVTTDQVARAASLIYQLTKVRQQIEHETLPPHAVRDLVPMCMQQYQYVFSTTRVPGKEIDTLRRWDAGESRHVAVLYKGGWYRVQLCLASGKPLTMFQIQAILQGIVDSRTEPSRPRQKTSRSMPDLSELALSNGPTEDPSHLLAALTTEGRTEWAFVRERHFSRGVNHASLDAIERAQFVVVLDDNAPTDYTSVARSLIHGAGATRWCDKSFNLVVFANGRCGIHAEHSWGDAPTMAHCFEIALAMEQTQTEYRFDAQGGGIQPRSATEESDGGRLRHIASVSAVNEAAADPLATGPTAATAAAASVSPRQALAPIRSRPDPSTRFKPAEQLAWDIGPELAASIHAAAARAQAAIKDFDLVVRGHDAFGKGLIKQMRVSPDAFVQMALQVAYHRDQGTFCQTYESSTARLFRNGRTETIRVVSEESCAFVRALEDPEVAMERKRELLHRAAEAHQTYTRDSMVGRAVDRHLFGLYVVAYGMGVESPFLTQAMSYKWRLSTSQVPPRQTPKNTWPGNDQADVFYSPSGGFGPVADDGYGVSYVISGERRLFLHVSSKRSAGNTDSQRFMDHALRALADLRALFPEL